MEKPCSVRAVRISLEMVDTPEPVPPASRSTEEEENKLSLEPAATGSPLPSSARL